MIESVAVRQRGAFDFETHYNNLCALQNSCPIPAVKTHLSDNVLDVNGDRIRATDWVPILNSLRINKTLEFIGIRSYYQHDKEKSTRANNKIPAVRAREITYRLCKGLRECLLATPSLTCIELQGIPFRDKDLSVLAKGLAKNSTLQHLSLEYSRVGDNGLEFICKGVKNTPNLASLNFTGCALTNRGADMLAKLIKHQSMKRHNEAWQDSLRYRRPDLDRMSGIRRITVNYNPLIGDEGATAFADALKDDLWLKALDLQHCGLTNEGAKALLDVLKYNTTVVVLDVRQNAMINQETIRNIMEQVIINCTGQDADYKWIKAEPMQDPTKQSPFKKKKPRNSQNSVKKTTIKVNGSGLDRRRSRSTGCMVRASRSPESHAPAVKPEPGVPWRTAMRASRCRGYPPDHHTHPDGYESFSDVSSMSSPNGKKDTSIFVEKEDSVDGTADSMFVNKNRSAKTYTEDGEQIMPLKQMRVELEQVTRRFQEEREARKAAEERMLELTVENKCLKTDIENFEARGSILDDDRVLESIETSFKQFHAFLDLLKEAGLGQLITLAGLDETSMCIPPRSSPERSRYLSRHDVSAAKIEMHQPSFADTSAAFAGLGLEDKTNLFMQERSRPPPQNGAITLGDLRSKGAVMHPNIQPQNYRDTQDPTMQHLADLQNPDSLHESRFDDLYQKVLKQTEGSLQRAQGDLIVQGMDVSLEREQQLINKQSGHRDTRLEDSENPMKDMSGQSVDDIMGRHRGDGDLSHGSNRSKRSVKSQSISPPSGEKENQPPPRNQTPPTPTPRTPTPRSRTTVRTVDSSVESLDQSPWKTADESPLKSADESPLKSMDDKSKEIDYNSDSFEISEEIDIGDLQMSNGSPEKQEANSDEDDF